MSAAIDCGEMGVGEWVPVVILRPQPGCDASVAAARAAGLDAHGFALFAIQPLAWAAPRRASFDALLLGSANALRHAGPALAGYAGMPAYVVGGQTAVAADAAGLEIAATGSGGLQQVLASVRPDHCGLLRLAGEARVELVAPPGVQIIERVVYASRPLPMPGALAALLAHPALVLLHSAESARHFAAECVRNGIDRSRLSLAALGPRIAAAAGPGWRDCTSAAHPCDAALLALARRMCDMNYR